MASMPPPSLHQNEPVEPGRPGSRPAQLEVVHDEWTMSAGATHDSHDSLSSQPRAGELTSGWRVVFGVGWLAAAVALAAVWSASRQIGLSTWWLGPAARPRPIVVNVLPFVAPLLLVAGALNRVRYLPWLGLAGAAVITAVGIGDLGRVRGFGLVELLIAAAAAAVSLASLAGMYRSAR